MRNEPAIVGTGLVCLALGMMFGALWVQIAPRVLVAFFFVCAFAGASLAALAVRGS